MDMERFEPMHLRCGSMLGWGTTESLSYKGLNVVEEVLISTASGGLEWTLGRKPRKVQLGRPPGDRHPHHTG